MKQILSLYLILLASTGFAQDEYGKQKSAPVVVDSLANEPDLPIVKSEFRKNLRLGGAFNIGSYSYQNSNINTQLFFVQVSPQLTYVLSDNFEGGISTSYSYTGTFADINAHSLSAGPILRGYLAEQFFLQVEGVAYYNHTSVKGILPLSTTSFNAFAGGGMISKLSDNSYILTGLKVNLIANSLTYNIHLPVAFTSVHFGF